MTNALSDAKVPEDQLAALEYLATRGPAAVEHCRSFYGVQGRTAKVHPQVAAAACHAGLLCGDEHASDAAIGALDLTDDDQRGRFLRPLTLSNHPDAISAMREYGERQPLEAARLLALHGGREALLFLPELVSRCDPEEVESVAFLATGSPMPRQSEVRAGSTFHPLRPEGAAEHVDVEAFEARLRIQLSRDPADRWLAGEPLTLARLRWLVPLIAGQGGQMLAERLALLDGRVCRVTVRDWMARRDRRLQILIRQRGAAASSRQ